MDTQLDERHEIGGNNPPTPTAFETVESNINDLYAEARNWCDGEPITSQEQADELNKLINLIGTAEKEAEALRKEEAKPFDDGKAEVQSRYSQLIGNTKAVKGRTVMALRAAKSALTPWLTKLAEEKAAVEEKAQAYADAAQEAATEAFQNTPSDDLAGREDAQRLADVAKQAVINAKVASKDKAQAKGGTGRATGLRSVWSAEVIDPKKFMEFLWTKRRPETDGWMREIAATIVRQNHDQEIPGVNIIETKKAV